MRYALSSLIALLTSFGVQAQAIHSSSAYSLDYVQKAYVAYYGRPADPAGQAYWGVRMDVEGGSLSAIIDAFGNSDEFNRRYGGLTAVALVTKIYRQTLDRDPDQGGLDYYVGALQAGRATLQSITLDVLNGATTAPDSLVMANKLEVAAHYTAKVAAGCAYGTEQDGVNALSGVTASSPTVTATEAAIDTRCGSAPPPPPGPLTCTITPSQTVSSNTSVTLTFSNCSVPGGGTIAYSWNQGSINGPQMSANPQYTTPLLTSSMIYFATVSANGNSTTYQVTLTVNASAPPPPPPGSCGGYPAIYLGDLRFDGSRIVTHGVTGSTVVFGRIVVANPLPNGWAGKVSSISAFEYQDPQYSKKIYVTKTPCDFGAVWPAYGEGTTSNVYTSFQSPMYDTVNMNAGDVWYVTVKNERLSGAPSCAQGASCNFGLNLAVPSAN